MKQQLVIWGALAMIAQLFSTLNVDVTTKSSSIANSELKAVETREPVFYNNPLLLNGQAFDYTHFSLASRGQLSVVVGSPETAEPERIPFRIYLRRNATTIQRGASDTARSVLSIDVTTVLALAQPGDMLVIEPTRKSDAQAGRRIKLKEFLFMPNLFSFFRNGKGGC